MKIHVTAEDIRNGVIADECRCPVALAIRRALGPSAEENVDLVWVDADDIIVRDHYYAVPVEVADFIDHFDIAYQGETFTFDLPIESEVA